jgi:KipI family sensor histidine kinase inhibitor
VLDISGETAIEYQRRIWWLAEYFRLRPDVREIVPGMNNLTVELDPASPELESLLDALKAGWGLSNAANTASRRVEIPVHYGGPAGMDLDQVAQQTGMSREQVISLHSAGEYTVYFLGFLPGFAYLGGMDKRLATSRRTEPRLAVPAGSIGIGGEQTGIYSLASPGGWQLIGRTALKLFDPGRDPPSLLLPGDSVRFTRVEENDD